MHINDLFETHERWRDDIKVVHEKIQARVFSLWNMKSNEWEQIMRRTHLILCLCVMEKEMCGYVGKRLKCR